MFLIAQKYPTSSQPGWKRQPTNFRRARRRQYASTRKTDEDLVDDSQV